MDQDLENTVDDLELRASPELVNQPAEVVQPMEAAIAGAAPDTRFAVNAPYWLNGLHNKAGLELADEINKVVSSKKLQEEQDAIEQILANYPDARRFGLTVISEKKHMDEPHRKINLAEPKSLLESAFVRDKDGAYRPALAGVQFCWTRDIPWCLRTKIAPATRLRSSWPSPKVGRRLN